MSVKIKYRYMIQRSRGFTIVELLIVIVVIAILAALSYVGYTNFAAKARDTVRQQDMATIKKALLAYNAQYGGVVATGTSPRYNVLSGSSGRGGWDASTDQNWLAFLTLAYGKMPVDPVNTMVAPSNNPQDSGPGHKVYRYFCYAYPGDAPYVAIGYFTDAGGYKSIVFEVDSCL